TFGDIRFGLRGLDIGQMPLGPSLRYQLETEDTILGQEHILLENVHAFDTLLTKTCRHGVITMEVLLQWTTHNSPKAVRRESTGLFQRLGRMQVRSGRVHTKTET